MTFGGLPAIIPSLIGAKTSTGIDVIVEKSYDDKSTIFSVDTSDFSAYLSDNFVSPSVIVPLTDRLPVIFPPSSLRYVESWLWLLAAYNESSVEPLIIIVALLIWRFPVNVPPDNGKYKSL